MEKNNKLKNKSNKIIYWLNFFSKAELMFYVFYVFCFCYLILYFIGFFEFSKGMIVLLLISMVFTSHFYLSNKYEREKIEDLLILYKSINKSGRTKRFKGGKKNEV